MPQPHLTVQVAHAAIAATNTYGQPNKTHPHLVVCTVSDERELAETFERLKSQRVPCCGIYEPDMGDSLTAVATAPLHGAARRPLQWLRLLR